MAPSRGETTRSAVQGQGEASGPELEPPPPSITTIPMPGDVEDELKQLIVRKYAAKILQTKGLKGGIPTGGSWYNSGQVGLNESALALVKAKSTADKQKADEKENQKKRELWELKLKVDAIGSKIRTGVGLTGDEMKDLIKFKKKGPGWAGRD